MCKGTFTFTDSYIKVVPADPEGAVDDFNSFEALVCGEYPYRKGYLNSSGLQSGEKPILVLYLHGGSARGTDNELQLTETGAVKILKYIVESGIPTIYILPQCSVGTSWGKSTNKGVKKLLALYEDSCSGIYAVGGAMGGTGTWSLANAYPGYFTGIMPCAGKPGSASASNFTTTRVYAVMGLSDSVMGEAYKDVLAFTEQISELGGSAVCDVIEGWSHTDTCVKSYTTERLDWLFGRQ